MAEKISKIQHNLQKRRDFELLRGQLEAERSSFLPHWRELGDYILPRRPRFFVTDTNRGERRSQRIIDSSGTMSARTLSSGMMSGLTSPARPWFRLTTPDPAMAESNPVRFWLQDVTNRMNTVFLRSNLYNTLPIIYGDLGVFGTAAMFIEEDFKDVIRTYSMPIGSYTIANDDRLKVGTFVREFRMTVRQIVQKFGEKLPNGGIDFMEISSHVKGMWANGNRDAWTNVVHIIKQNEFYKPNNPFSKKFISSYYERGASRPQGGINFQGPANDEGKFLRESGFNHFPILAPRWEVTGEDTYGTSCPGMIALGDIKQLQTGEKRSLQAIEKKVNPPMIAPTALRRAKSSILPGDITYMDEREGIKGFRPAHEVNFQVTELEAKQEQCRQRISRAFYEDLFLMLSRLDRREITAREIDERHEEKLLALGPVLEQLNQDLLDPLIDITFDIMMRQGLIPEPPPELEGLELKVEYVSIMSQSQKLVGLSAIERFANFSANVAAVKPSVLDKIDADQMIDAYADITSVPPGLVKSDEEVAQIREKRAEEAEKQKQLELIAAGGQVAKDLAGAKTNEDNALTAITGKTGVPETAKT